MKKAKRHASINGNLNPLSYSKSAKNMTDVIISAITFLGKVVVLSIEFFLKGIRYPSK